MRSSITSAAQTAGPPHLGGAEPPRLWTVGTSADADPHSLTDLFVIVVYTI
jgi:hypothetical protein